MSFLRNFVGRQALVSPEVIDWQVNCFEWLLRRTGGIARFRRAPMILPTVDFFPTSNARGAALATELFITVRQHAGMSKWPCALVSQANHSGGDFSRMGLIESSGVRFEESLRWDNRGATITYDPAQVAKPGNFVATLAQQLGRHLVASFNEPPPGGLTRLGPAADMAAAFLGFGIFQVNAAFGFSRSTITRADHWQALSQGYLTESEALNGLALCTAAKEVSHTLAKPFLDAHTRSHYRRACKEMATYVPRLLERGDATAGKYHGFELDVPRVKQRRR